MISFAKTNRSAQEKHKSVGGEREAGHVDYREPTLIETRELLDPFSIPMRKRINAFINR